MGSLKTRNILLSAFACSPTLGSEDGVGWHWAIELANLGNNVTVLTRTRFKDEIELYIEANPLPNISFYYLDFLPKVHYNGSPSLISYLYIHIWQALAVAKVKQIVSQTPIELIHHITFAGIRLPSFLGCLGIPFIFGPVGGGEETPPTLLRSFPFKARMKERLRWLSNRLVRFDPMMRYTFASSTIIGLTTKDSVSVIPPKYHDKIIVSSTIGVDEVPISEPKFRNTSGEVVLLFAGRFLHWKGMHLGIRAFSKVRKRFPNARLTMVGDGPACQHWKKIAEIHEIADGVTWFNWVTKAELVKLYSEAGVFLFPSLHDSGGMVVLEAASYGLPILCLDIGGPGEMVGPEVGLKIPVRDLSEEIIIDKMAAAMEDLISDPEYLAHLSRSATEWSKKQGWSRRVSDFYTECDKIIDRHISSS